MAILPILHFPDPRLRNPSQPVARVDDELRTLLDDMLQTMYEAPGIGRDGPPFEIEADGLLAVCIQHEIDHLEGKLFVDYLSELKRNRIRKKMEKLRPHTLCAGRRPGPSPDSPPCRRRSDIRGAEADLRRHPRLRPGRARGLAAIAARGPCRLPPARTPRRPRSQVAAKSREAIGRGGGHRGATAGEPETRGRAHAPARVSGRCEGGGGLRAHPAAGGAGHPASRLPQHPCLTAAALARRGANTARLARR